MKICIISVNKSDYAPRRFFEEGKKRGHQMYLTTWASLVFKLDEDGFYLGDGNKKIDEFDAIIPRSPSFSLKNKRGITSYRLGTLLKLIIEHAKNKKIFVLNSKFFESYQSLDKLAQQFFLLKNNIPGLDSYFFSPEKSLNKKNILLFPFIVKTTQGSLGKGVYKINSPRELKACITKSRKNKTSLLFQRYYPIIYDYRVLIVKNRPLGAMRRSSSGKEWRTNVSLGGKVDCAPKAEEKKLYALAKKTAQAMGLDYAGIDILKDGDSFRVIEINALAQFRGFEKLYTNINVAREVLKLAEIKTKKRKTS
ncbi:MAG: hypothetical protein A3J06_00895 [Candidatus Moranbacteria bacterium RIFCSPLOWO2_02_FULL_48_19]|nr:MAG: hypothetical protein A3J06_00895 [Candidatus Moranbacteria bacterium RIFCSPLOWO2_02_FULL_48_19]OGI31555.1 MAG: hypothetical protein A3G09_04550 [Candidatus Moranbacteria bacterium RIFCSPLOWO2_12_FULL_48_12]